MMLLIGMLRVLFREGQKKIEKKSIFHSSVRAPLRHRVTQKDREEKLRGEKRVRKKN
jgi:hypothetical protein